MIESLHEPTAKDAGDERSNRAHDGQERPEKTVGDGDAVDPGLWRRQEEGGGRPLARAVPSERRRNRDHAARAERQRHPEDARLDHLAETVATEVALDPLRRDDHRQQPGNHESEQQVGRHGAEDRPRGGDDRENEFHHLLSL